MNWNLLFNALMKKQSMKVMAFVAAAGMQGWEARDARKEMLWQRDATAAK